ncbi:MAG: hypothetical protein JWN67_1911 [Actinomycetia bacterium]|nr:hypothetical protein [Actinomycetes bacterium]
MTAREPPLLWSSLDEGLDGLALVVRGELSTRTAPALDSLVEALLDARERLVSIDLRDTRVLSPAGERLLERWAAAPGRVPGTYRLDGVRAGG